MGSRAVIRRIREVRAQDIAVDELRAFAADFSPRVRAEVAQSPKAPADLLVKLVTDPSIRVKVAALSNPALPAAARSAVAQNSQIREVLTAAVDGAPDTLRVPLAAIVAERMQELKQGARASAIEASNTAALVAEAKNAATLPPRLAQLARSGNAKVQAAVARNAKASAPTLRGLSRNADPSVRIGVAVNKNTPLDARQYLVKHDPTAAVVQETISCARQEDRKALKSLAASSMHLHIQSQWKRATPKESRNPQPGKTDRKVPLCPTPKKKRYDTRSRAFAYAVRTAEDFGKAAEPYKCACGSYHVTTKVRKNRHLGEIEHFRAKKSGTGLTRQAHSH